MLAKRALFVTFGIPLLVAIAMTLVDSYRRRGKKPKPFPTHGRSETRGRRGHRDDVHLRPGPVRRHARRHRGGAEPGPVRDLHLEGRRGRRALQEGAHRRGRPRRRGLRHLRRVRQPRGRPAVQALPAEREGARATPSTPPGWRFFDLRRYGRDHRKILVVDDEVGFVGGYNIGSAYATEWRDTHCRITGPGVWDLKRAFADFWNLHREKRFRRSERAAADVDRLDVGAEDPGAPQRAPAVDVPDPGRCTSRRSTGRSATSG